MASLAQAADRNKWKVDNGQPNTALHLFIIFACLKVCILSSSQVMAPSLSTPSGLTRWRLSLPDSTVARSSSNCHKHSLHGPVPPKPVDGVKSREDLRMKVESCPGLWYEFCTIWSEGMQQHNALQYFGCRTTQEIQVVYSMLNSITDLSRLCVQKALPFLFCSHWCCVGFGAYIRLSLILLQLHRCRQRASIL